ncbi:MAG: hypothetical protein CW691_09135 [Candidatus Bathyarchaeum sp.]|nr:MAG: hypothetical protein CW691_09135 [Candidatus Bathyarchaeum sp.]
MRIHGWFPCRIGGKPFGVIQRWVGETENNGIVRWSVDQENLDRVLHLNVYNQDQHEKEVRIEITKVWDEQNYQTGHNHNFTVQAIDEKNRKLDNFRLTTFFILFSLLKKGQQDRL